MKLLRAVISGIILWVLIFFEVSILMFGFGLEEGFGYYIVHYILLALFAVLVSLIYFRGKKVKAGWWNGFLLGIVLIITGIILDILITVSLFVNDYNFFDDIYLWYGYAEILVISVIVGILKN